MPSKKYEIKDERVIKSLEKKETLTARLTEITDQLKKLQDEGNGILSRLQREEEKVRNNHNFNEFLKTIEVGPYEEISRVYKGLEGDEIGHYYVQVADRLEEEYAKIEQFKIDFLKAKQDAQQDAKNNSSNTDEGDGDSDDDVELPAEKPEDDSNIG